jgi:hypothetical protein
VIICFAVLFFIHPAESSPANRRDGWPHSGDEHERKGIGANLASDKALLSLLDKWIDTGSSFVAENMK